MVELGHKAGGRELVPETSFRQERLMKGQVESLPPRESDRRGRVDTAGSGCALLLQARLGWARK